MEPILIYIVTPIFGILSSIVTWLLARKKNELDLDYKELTNLRENIKLYQDMIDDLKKRYDADLESMHAKMKLMERDLEDCRKRHRN